MNICIIPARAGSKRIPNKNIKDFLGKPIISYSIELAIKSNIFDKIIVSTDSTLIAEVSIKYGAEVPFFRPKELSDDYTGTHDVIRHAVEWLENSGEIIDYTCCLYPTAPLVQKKDLIEGFNIIKTNKWNSVIAATSYSYPIFRSFKKTHSGGLKMLFPKYYKSRSQDLPKVYHDAGLFYWAKSNVWKKKSTTFNDKITIVEIPNFRVQDIDDIEDWKRAELIFKILSST